MIILYITLPRILHIYFLNIPILLISSLPKECLPHKGQWKTHVTFYQNSLCEAYNFIKFTYISRVRDDWCSLGSAALESQATQKIASPLHHRYSFSSTNLHQCWLPVTFYDPSELAWEGQEWLESQMTPSNQWISNVNFKPFFFLRIMSTVYLLVTCGLFQVRKTDL